MYLIKGIIKRHRTPNVFEGLFFFWCVYIIVSGFLSACIKGFDNLQFKQFLSGGYTLYLLPMLMIYTPSTSFLRKYFRLSYVYAFLCICTMVILSKDIFVMRLCYAAEQATYFASGLALILMTYSYWKKKNTNTAFVIVMIVIIVMMILGRRNKVVYFGALISFSVLLNTMCKSYFSNANKKISVIVLIAFVALVVVSLFSAELAAFVQRMNTGMSSRETALDLFFADFNRHPSDWIFGRGMFGEYWGGELSTNLLADTRDGIENGYLQIILKGGWIWLGFIILFSVKAFYLGMFRSRNLLCKGMALIILIYFIDMIGFGIPCLYFSYINVFLSIAGCNSKWLRNQTDIKLQPRLKFYK
jgi:hypothetical protein